MTKLEQAESSEVAELRANLASALNGRYKIADVLGAGRGGVVFRARHLASKRDVALKVAWNEPRARSQVLRELSLTAQVVHPNVMTMNRLDVPDSLIVVEMPLATGGTLHDLIDSGVRTSFARTLEILRGVGGALDQAHHSGIVHGTLCPVKFLIDDRGQVLLSDFGLRMGVGSDSGAVRPSNLGSPAYTPLEQRHDSPEMGGRADQYALAIIAFEMLRGRRTWRFNSEGVLEVEAIEIPTHRPIAAGVPLTANAAIRRGTSKDPSFRYDSMADFVRHYAGETATVVAAEHLQREVITLQRSHSKLWLAVGAIVLLVSALGLRPTVRDSVRGWWHLKMMADPIPQARNSPSNSPRETGQPGTQPGVETQRARESSAPNNTREKDTSRVRPSGPDRAIDPFPRTARPQPAASTPPSSPKEESRRVAPPPDVAPAVPSPNRASSDTGVRRETAGPGPISDGRVEDALTGVIAVTLIGGSRAAVLIDGTPRGQTPLRWRASAGPHVVKLRGLGRYSPDSMVVTTIVSDTVKAAFRTVSPP
jgi:serine/threonine protein kinase